MAINIPRRSLPLLTAVAAAAASLALLASPALAAAGDDVTFTATINGREVRDSSDYRPVVLDPQGNPILQVTVTNNTEEPVGIRSVRLEGQVMGVAFYSYDTAVGMVVDAGETDERRFEMDLFGVKDQAVGLIPSRVVLIGEDREALGSTDFTADVKGELTSTYGIFGFGVALMTAVTLGGALLKLARHNLPENRWARAWLFLTPGVGLGLTILFTLSALRIWAASAGKWVPIVFGMMAAGFLFGYLTPNPADEEDEEEEEELAALEAEQGLLPRQDAPPHERETVAAPPPPPRSN